MEKYRKDFLRRISIVLVRPIRAGNIGAAARAMKNMGFSQLVLVAPAVDPRSSEAYKMAYKMAYGAAEVLDKARIVKTLPQAISKARLVFGTTVRHRKGYGQIPSLPQMVPEILSQASRQRIALIFGSERTGLANQEIALCHRLMLIPTAPAFPSLNLGHAVAVVLYELFKASAPNRSFPVPDHVLATTSELERFYADLERHLSLIGFIKGQQGRFILADLRRIFGRSGLDAREVRILRGILTQARWAESRIENPQVINKIRPNKK